MKKTIIALMLSSLSLSAFADVTLYGEIKAGVEFQKIKESTEKKKKKDQGSTTKITDWESFIGFKGEEEVGDELKAIWQVEQTIMEGRFASRETFIGLGTSIGTFRLGLLKDSLKSLDEVIDPWEGATSHNTLKYFTRNADYLPSIRYDSPDLGGFSFNIGFTPEDNIIREKESAESAESAKTPKTLQEALKQLAAGGNIIGDDQKARYIASVGLGYELNGFFAKYAFKNKHFTIKSTDSEGKSKSKNLNAQVHNAVLGYHDDNFSATLAVQRTKDYDDHFKSTQEEALTLAYTLDNITPRVTWYHGDGKLLDDDSKKKSKRDIFIIGADYAFSKRTSALFSVGFSKIRESSTKDKKNKSNPDVDSSDSSKEKNQRVQTWSAGVGLKHVF